MIMKATIDAQGLVHLVVRDWPQGWSVEEMCFRRLNVASCEIFTGGKRTPIIDAYLPPSTLEHLQELEEALKRFWDKYSIVIGDLSADIGKAHNPRSQQVADLFINFGPMELLLRFYQK